MTGECTYLTYYQRVVSVDKGSVIIRYKKQQISLSKNVLRGGEPRSPVALLLVRYTTRELLMLKQEV